MRRLYSEAFTLQAQYKPQQAITTLNSLLAIDSSFYPAYNLMGYIYEDAYADLDSALLCYRRALAINPDYAKAYLNIGHLHYRQMHYDTAMAYINKSIAIDSNYADAWFNLGWVYNSKSDLRTSLRLFRKAAVLGSSAARKWLEDYGYSIDGGDDDDTPAATNKQEGYRREKHKPVSVEY